MAICLLSKVHFIAILSCDSWPSWHAPSVTSPTNIIQYIAKSKICNKKNNLSLLFNVYRKSQDDHPFYMKIFDNRTDFRFAHFINYLYLILPKLCFWLM